MSRAPISRTYSRKSADVAGTPPTVEVGHEGRTADGPEDEAGAPEDEVARRVSSAQRERRWRHGNLLFDEAGLEADAAVGALDAHPTRRLRRGGPGRGRP